MLCFLVLSLRFSMFAPSPGHLEAAFSETTLADFSVLGNSVKRDAEDQAKETKRRREDIDSIERRGSPASNASSSHLKWADLSSKPKRGGFDVKSTRRRKGSLSGYSGRSSIAGAINGDEGRPASRKWSATSANTGWSHGKSRLCEVMDVEGQGSPGSSKGGAARSEAKEKGASSRKKREIGAEVSEVDMKSRLLSCVSRRISSLRISDFPKVRG